MIEVIHFAACLLIVALVIWVFNEMWGEEPPKRVPHPVDVADLLKLMGSEGDDLPRMDIRKEVAEQLGCEDDLLIKPKRRERAGRGTPPPVKFGDMLILMGSEGDNLPRSRPGPGKEAEHE
jgi:hypothetical protein